MSPDTKKLLERVAAWPEENQEELAEVAAENDARRSGVYRLSDDERKAVEQGMADTRAGRFASDEDIKVIFDKAPAPIFDP